MAASVNASNANAAMTRSANRSAAMPAPITSASIRG
jgi:hypothetical protein